MTNLTFNQILKTARTNWESIKAAGFRAVSTESWAKYYKDQQAAGNPVELAEMAAQIDKAFILDLEKVEAHLAGGKCPQCEHITHLKACNCDMHGFLTPKQEKQVDYVHKQEAKHDTAGYYTEIYISCNTCGTGTQNYKSAGGAHPFIQIHGGHDTWVERVSRGGRQPRY